MKILSVQLKNIKSHRERRFEFAEGINVLAGPNGIGKSTIFEAIGYALFGVDAQSFVGNVERFISIGAQKGEVKVEFQPGDGERFQVSRTVGSPSKWLLYKQLGEQYEVEEHKDNRETESRLKDLLGLNNGRPLAEQFELVIGPFQHEFLGPFVIKQAAKRRDRFDEILGIDTWRKTHKETLALEKAIKNKVEVLQAEITSRQEQVEVLPAKQAELQETLNKLAECDKELAGQQQLLQDLEKQLAAQDHLEQSVTRLQAEISTLNERLANGREKITTQQQRIADAQQAEQIVTQTLAAKDAFEKAEQQLSQLHEQLKQQRLIEQEAAGLEKKLSSLQGQLMAETKSIELTEKELSTTVQHLQRRKQSLQPSDGDHQLAAKLPQLRTVIAELRQQSGKLDGRHAGLIEGSAKLAEGVCPFFQEPCQNLQNTQPEIHFNHKTDLLLQDKEALAEKLKDNLDQEQQALSAENRIKELQLQQQSLQEQLQRTVEQQQHNQLRKDGLAGLREQQAELQQQHESKNQILSTFSRLQSEIADAEQLRNNNQQAREKHLANLQLAGEHEVRRNELLKFQLLLEQLQQELNEKQTELQRLTTDYSAEQHRYLRLQKDQLQETLGILRQKLLNFQSGVARLKEEIEKLTAVVAAIEQKKAAIKKYLQKEELVKFLRSKVFRNVSAYLSERFRREISQRADRIYRTIAERDEELCWGENYQIVLRDMVAGELRERVDDQLSGGQTMSAVVALRLALLQTIGARIAFFDEPTSNLDAVRRENLAYAFRAIDVGREEVTEHWYDQLFLISHDVAFTEVTDQIVVLDP